jgi:hypothetical protein
VVQFGEVKAGRAIAGTLDARGDLRIDLLGFGVNERATGGTGLWGGAPKVQKAAKVPFVPLEALAAASCVPLTAEAYAKELAAP